MARGRAGGERLGEVARELDAAIGDDRRLASIRAALAQSAIAVSCGTPTPATIRVVQIEPGPMPTFTASAPASISALQPSPVATLPAMTCTRLESFFTRSTAIQHRARMAVRRVDHQRVDACIDQRLTERSKPASPTVDAAATRRRPCSSLQAFGLAWLFSMSLTVIRPTQRPSSSTTISRSMRCLCSSLRASAGSAPSRTVTTFVRHQLGRPAGCRLRQSARRGW